MQTAQFINIIRNPQQIYTEEVKELRSLLYEYPYFQLACMLIAKSQYEQDPSQAQQAIQLAAVYATDRQQLKLFLENKLNFKKNTPVVLPPQEISEQKKEISVTQKEDKYEINKTPTNQFANETTRKTPVKQVEFINSYISSLSTKDEKKVTNRKSLKQLNIIENFIKQGIKFKPMTIHEMTLEEAHVDLTKQSTMLNDNLLTESLAQIMLKQGRFDKAIDIYNRLQVKYPEKISYFAKVINELKNNF